MSPPRRVAPSTLVICNFKAPAFRTRREVVLAHLARASFACMQRILLLPSVTSIQAFQFSHFSIIDSFIHDSSHIAYCPCNYVEKLRRHNESSIYLSNVNPVRGHKEVRRSTGHMPVLSTCPLHTKSGCGKERRILIG